MRKYGVLRINLSSPILFPSNHPWEGIKLDGLLGWIWAKDNGYTKTPAENKPENIVFPKLPLAEIAPQLYGASTMFIPTPDELWENKADAFRPNLVSCYPEVIVRSTNWDRSMKAQIRQGLSDFKLNIKTGAYRGAMETYWALSTPYIYFYFATDDFEALAKYLDRIQKECFGIGAKTRIGYGRITDIEYSELEEEECFYYEYNGLPTRPIPVESPFKGKFPDSCLGYSSWRMPYFSPTTKAMCYLPPVAQYLPQALETNSPILDNLLDKVAKDQQRIFTLIQEKEAKKSKRKVKK